MRFSVRKVVTYMLKVPFIFNYIFWNSGSNIAGPFNFISFLCRLFKHPREPVPIHRDTLARLIFLHALRFNENFLLRRILREMLDYFVSPALFANCSNYKTHVIKCVSV